jgi:hypothetical protein
MTEGSLLPEKSHGQSKTIDRGYLLQMATANHNG